MKRIKFNLIIINLFIIFIFNNSLKAESNFYIIAKVDNEIITNVDISQEANYLIALNNDLKKIDKRFIINMAKDSLIREKVKKNELKKNSKHLSVKNDVLKMFIQNFYKGLNIENENKFKNYLSSYNLDLSTVEDKIKTEILWNQLIYLKFVNQININHEKLKKKVSQNKDVDNKIKKYLLSEILFSLENKKNFEMKNIEIRKKIQENGFKTAANIYSISDTAKFGGRIGLVDERQLSEKIFGEINSINPGEITNTINVPNGYLILKLEEIVVEEFKKDLKKELDKLIKFETDRQLNQFSIIYYNKIKLNSKISEE
jgi:peptidyl-prolyl cis-trans isomerase SurA